MKFKKSAEIQSIFLMENIKRRKIYPKEPQCPVILSEGSAENGNRKAKDVSTRNETSREQVEITTAIIVISQNLNVLYFTGPVSSAEPGSSHPLG
ncbi:MAG: hypothetical protein JXR66_02550 [Bacteroidales bacterium]|nr:hypothetical protein [Bacteroidales bacterium]MBN2632407.1 hypothetical protein [Bacteroidales bacterium]